jgi:hypothetical protein
MKRKAIKPGCHLSGRIALYLWEVLRSTMTRVFMEGLHILHQVIGRFLKDLGHQIVYILIMAVERGSYLIKYAAGYCSMKRNDNYCRHTWSWLSLGSLKKGEINKAD